MTPTQQPHVTPERLMQMAWAYAPPLMIEAGVRCGIFDTLDAGPLTAEQVSAATGASLRGVRSIMNALTGLQFLAKDSDGRYALTPESSAFLVSSKPGFQGGMFRHISQDLLPKWLDLDRIVRDGQPSQAVNQESTGSVFFEHFVEDIFPLSYRAAQTLAEALGVAGLAESISVLDIAAGSGVWGIALAQASPRVEVTAVDWANVLPATSRMVERFGLTKRFRFVSGDLLEADFGSGHAVATLGHILHSEGEKRSQALLNRVFAALAPGGTIAIQEFLVNDDRTGPPHSLIFAVNMLVNTEYGDTYSFSEIRGWLEAAGFVNARTLEAPGPSPLILADKPAGDS